MEASAVATPEDVAENFDGEAEATRSTAELFEYSAFVHVGGGAEDCEQRVSGCKNPKHFHAWLCLPNAFQIRDITDKARAAKARKTRALRDPESDSFVTLEAEVDEALQADYEGTLRGHATLIVERQLADVLSELNEDERFEHQQQDAEEFRRLQGVPEDERDSEEYERLEAQMLAYAETMQEEIDRRIEAEYGRLAALSREELAELERAARIELIANETYNHTFYTWSIYVGTREPTTEGFSSRRKFATPDELRTAPPEVIVALRRTIRDLEERTVTRGDAAGN